MLLNVQQLKSLPSKQKGFTLIELVIVMLVIAALTLISVFGYKIYTENAKYTGAKDFFITKAPAAMATHVLRKDTLTGITKAKIVSYGLPGTTAWEDTWTITGPVAGVVTFVYPLSSAGDPDTVGADLEDLLSSGRIPQIASASYAAGTKTITVGVRAQ